MNPKIVEIQERKLIGMRSKMSIIDNKTGALFGRFMPRKKEITNTLSDGVYALQQYDFDQFTPELVFEKWACIEVRDFNNVPSEMETLILPAGKYAVFTHKGTTLDFVNSMQQFMEDWLPNSNYKIDSRPHFEYLGNDYLGPMNPESQEDVYIPIV